jgi:hypothetical protein
VTEGEDGLAWEVAGLQAAARMCAATRAQVATDQGSAGEAVADRAWLLASPLATDLES